MAWDAEVELVAELDQDQLDALAHDTAALAVYYNSAGRMIRLRSSLRADDFDAALEEARVWASTIAVPPIRKHWPEALVVRLAVEQRGFGGSGWAAGAKEAAELLGVSPARVRQIEGQPGFPAPVADLAGGAVWRADEVETYGRTRVRGKGGRPRKAVPEA